MAEDTRMTAAQVVSKLMSSEQADVLRESVAREAGGDHSGSVASVQAETVTPAELAFRWWGSSEGYSRSPGATKIRKIARGMFPDDAPGQGGTWHLTSVHVEAIQRQLRGVGKAARDLGTAPRLDSCHPAL
jgi:hypothetical protein